MKLAVIGSRTFNNVDLLNEILKQHLDNISCIISGGANGADSLAENWAKQNNIDTEIYLPDWQKYGKQAGYLRNVEIIKNSDQCIAFWDGKSKGTAHSISLCKKLKKPYTIIEI